MMAAVPDWRPPGLELLLPSPVEELYDESLASRGVRVLLKRDDLIHPELSGNRWRKLKYILSWAADSGQRTLLTFGGAYSNHIRAVAAAGRYLGLATIGVIRGEEHLPLNPTLAYARELPRPCDVPGRRLAGRRRRAARPLRRVLPAARGREQRGRGPRGRRAGGRALDALRRGLLPVRYGWDARRHRRRPASGQASHGVLRAHRGGCGTSR